MSEPQFPSQPCPSCRAASAEPVNVSYTYEPHGAPGDPDFERVLSAITYTFQCGTCGHKYAICEDTE